MLTGLAVVLTCAMYLIRDDPSYLWAGLVLLAATAACGDLASVPYNAMLRQLSTPQTVGPDLRLRLGSGLRRQRPAAAADLPGIHFRHRPTMRGLLHVPVHDGLYVRTAMLLAAAWLAVLALPLLLVAHRLPDAGEVAPPDEHAGWLSQAVDGDQRGMAARPQPGLLPGRQRALPGRAGGDFRLRRCAGRQRVRHLAGRRADIRCGGQRGGRGGRGARRVRRPPDRIQTGHRRRRWSRSSSWRSP